MKINFSEDEWNAIADALEAYVLLDVISDERQEYLLEICEKIDHYMEQYL